MTTYENPCLAPYREDLEAIQKNIDARIKKVLPHFHELLQFYYGAKFKSSLIGDFKMAAVSLRLDPVNEQSAAADAVSMFCRIRHIPAMSEYEISDYRPDDQYQKGKYGVYFTIYYK